MVKIYHETEKSYLVNLIIQLKDGRVGSSLIWIPKEHINNPDDIIKEKLNSVVYSHPEVVQSYHLQDEKEQSYKYISDLLYIKDNIIDTNYIEMDNYLYIDKPDSKIWNIISYANSGGLYLSFRTDKVKFHSLVVIRKNDKYYIPKNPPIIHVYEASDNFYGKHYRVDLYYQDKKIKNRLKRMGINPDDYISSYVKIINL